MQRLLSVTSERRTRGLWQIAVIHDEGGIAIGVAAFQALLTFQVRDRVRTFRTTADPSCELELTTPSRRWHFSGRSAAPRIKLSFVNQAEKSVLRDSKRLRLKRATRRRASR